MICRECFYFIRQSGDAGLCVSPVSDKICAPGGCTGLPFRRVFGSSSACTAFKRVNP